MNINENTFKRRAGIAIAAVVLVIIALVCYASFVSAHYLTDRTTEDSAVSDEFYFTSDLLQTTDDSSNPAIVYLTGTSDPKTATIALRNFEDNLRYSAVDIPYTLTATKSGESAAAVTKKSTDSGTSALTGGTASTANVTLSTSGDSAGTITSGSTYLVKAIANASTTSGEANAGTYQKVLSRTILFTEPDAAIHSKTEWMDEGAYTDVSVWNTGNSNTTVTLTYPNTLTPDNSDSKMSTWTNASASNSATATIEKNECHVFRFFKDDGATAYVSSVSNATGEATVNIYAP